MALIGQHQQTLFSNPQNGQSPIDADVVRNNDNALRSKLNAHDGDATIHVQSGLLSARPAANVVGAMYMDENGRLYRDNGVTWDEIPYLRLASTGTSTMQGSLVIVQNLAVDGLTDLNGNTVVDGNLNVTGTITAAGISAPTTVPASSVTAATFASGNFVFPNALTVNGALNAAGILATGNISASQQLIGSSVSATSGVFSSTGVLVDWSGAQSFSVETAGVGLRRRLTGNTTVTVINVGGITVKAAYVMIQQNGTGSHTLSWTGVTWPGGVAPTQTSTANRADLYLFVLIAGTVFGTRLAADFAV